MAFRNVHIKDSQQLIISVPSRSKSVKWEPFWGEVDLAERLLVSGMFEDAAVMALEMLDRLQSAEVADSWVAQQGKDMTEQVVTYASGNGRGAVIASATMVLIQAHHQLDRHAQLATTIRSKFKGVARVPPQAFLAWVCLQVAAMEFKLAREALEDFLAAAAAFHASAMEQLAQEGVLDLHLSEFASCPAGSGLLMPRSPLASGEQVMAATGFGSGVVCQKRWKPRKSEIVVDVAEHIPEGAECLTLQEYEVLVGIYTREVLSRGFGEPANAIHWLANSNNLLSPDRRQVLINQVEGIGTTLLGTPREVSGRGALFGSGAEEGRGSTPPSTSAGEAVTGRRPGRALAFGRGQNSWTSWLAALRVWLKVKYYALARKVRNASVGHMPLTTFCRYLALALMGGWLAYAAARKRQAIARLLRRAVDVPRGILLGILETVREEVDEFWQLAFQVNANPGARLPRLQGSVRQGSTSR